MSKVYKINPNEIIIETDRDRTKFDEKPLEELKRSIYDLGQLQPGLCVLKDGKPTLIVGERRLKACKELEIDFSYILQEESDEFTLKSIELAENIFREDLHWFDRIQAKTKLHKLFAERYKIGGIRKTASILGESKSLLAADIELAQYASNIPEIKEAKTISDAKKILMRLKKQLSRKEALDETFETIEQKTSPSLSPSLSPSSSGFTFRPALTDEDKKAFADGFSPGIEDPSLNKFFDSPQDDPKRIKVPFTPKLSTQETLLLEFASKCILSDFKTFEPTQLYDVVIFDPPWGVDFDKVKKENHSTEDYSDSLENFQIHLKEWLSKIWDLMLPDSHLYMFYGIVNNDFIWNTLESIGFETNRIPIIWHKKGAHRTRSPKLFPGRAYEPIAFARKGSKDLAIQGRPDVIVTPLASQTMKDIHSSAKHPAIMKDLLLRSCEPKDKVLDPMAGSGMTGVAAEDLHKTHKLDWTLVEKEEHFRNLQLINLLKGYDSIINVKSPSKSGGFRKLEIASLEWREYWKTHPREQDDMIAWSKSQRGVNK